MRAHVVAGLATGNSLHRQVTAIPILEQKQRQDIKQSLIKQQLRATGVLAFNLQNSR